MTAGTGGAPLGDLEGRLHGRAFLESLPALDDQDLGAARDVLELVADALLENALQVLADWEVSGAPRTYVFRLPSGRFTVVRISGDPGEEEATFGPVEDPPELR